MRPHSLLAYDDQGNVVGTLDHLVMRNATGEVIGLRDFEAHELAGGQHTDYFNVEGAVGSGTWPEWLAAGAHAHRVELTGKRITALVHRGSGRRRERHHVERDIAATPVVGGVHDIRHIVGGPQRPLLLDETGETIRHMR